MRKVTLEVPDDLWDQLLGRVPVNPKGNPSEFARAMAKELRLVLSAGMGPNPKSVIHAIKAKERGEAPPAESAVELERIRGQVAADEALAEVKRAAARKALGFGMPKGGVER